MVPVPLIWMLICRQKTSEMLQYFSSLPKVKKCNSWKLGDLSCQRMEIVCQLLKGGGGNWQDVLIRLYLFLSKEIQAGSIVPDSDVKTFDYRMGPGNLYYESTITYGPWNNTVHLILHSPVLTVTHALFSIT